MALLRLTLEYDGTDFRGWARQPGLRTVEGVLAEGLDRVFPSWNGLQVAGRTDAGVHALAQVASLEVEGGPPLEHAAEALNAVLPRDVAVVTAAAAPPGFHARFSARSRSYRYRIDRRATPSPFEARRSWWLPQPLDEERLHEAAALLPGKHDFRAFTPTETQHDVFVRVVEQTEWRRQGDALEFEITADSFLRHMVRTLVGAMIDLEPGDLAALLRGAPREQAGRTAPPQGLYLIAVAYDQEQ
jgi:tRNA pseudouridine38-40 synthase